MASRRIRVLTYNVRGCRGLDGRISPERVLEVIEAAHPDVAALQEMDAGQKRSRGLDQTRFLAERLAMDFFFVAARKVELGHFGNALLSRVPCASMHFGQIPQLYETSELRAAQWVVVDGPFGAVHVINTHLGLRGHERLVQARSLLGDEWLESPHMGEHVVLCGDLNARPGTPAYAELATVLRDAQLDGDRRARATFPALIPLVRLDHVFLSRSLAVERVEVPAGLARFASDHRPLVVDLVERAGQVS